MAYHKNARKLLRPKIKSEDRETEKQISNAAWPNRQDRAHRMNTIKCEEYFVIRNHE